MGKESKIEWCTSSHNFWYGCTKVSPGCDHCYAEQWAKRYGKNFDIITKTKRFDMPIYWRDPLIIFVESLGDFFHSGADNLRDDAWDIMRQAPHHTYLLLTKRPENIIDRLPKNWGDGWDNVWLGVTAENQEMVDKRIPILLSVPAAVRFVSIEPMLGKIDLKEWIGDDDCETKKCRGNSLSSCTGGRIGDRFSRANLENIPTKMVQMDSKDYDLQMQPEASGKGCRRLLCCENDGKQCSDFDVCSKTCVETFFWKDTFKFDNKPQKRKQEGQSSGEFGAGDVLRTNSSLNPSFRSARQAGRAGKICWIVCGAESGPNRRPINIEWVRDLKDQCSETKTPFMYKQGPDDFGKWVKTPVLDGQVWNLKPEMIKSA